MGGIALARQRHENAAARQHCPISRKEKLRNARLWSYRHDDGLRAAGEVTVCSPRDPLFDAPPGSVAFCEGVLQTTTQRLHGASVQTPFREQAALARSAPAAGVKSGVPLECQFNESTTRLPHSMVDFMQYDWHVQRPLAHVNRKETVWRIPPNQAQKPASNNNNFVLRPYRSPEGKPLWRNR